MIVIDSMEISDLEEVIALWTKIEELYFSPAFDTPERLTRFLTRNGGISTVARLDGELAGAILCGHDGRRGFIYHSGVDYPYRRQGIARRMLERCFDKLRLEQIDSCFLFTHDFNKEAQAFWGAQGFIYAPGVMYHSRAI